MIASLRNPRTRSLEWLVELVVLAMLPSMAGQLVIGARMVVHDMAGWLTSSG